MADDPTTTPTADQMQAQAAATDNATKSTSLFGDMLEGVQAKFSGFFDKIKGLNSEMDKNNQMTLASATTFGILANNLVGVKSAFDGLDRVDTKGLNTISDQIKGISGLLEGSIISDQIEALKKKNITPNTAGYADAVQKIKEGAIEIVGAFTRQATQAAESASSFQKLENAYIQLSAQSGDLGGVWDKAGKDLTNLNNVIGQQDKVITDAAGAANMTKDAMAKYYAVLGEVPQALNTLVESTDKAGGSTSMLVATTQLAVGTGRSYTDVIKDIKTAYDDYNLTGERALQFTARISEISGKYGIELENVRSTITRTADSFKMFGNEGEGAAHIMNEYIGAFEKTELSGSASLELIENITSGIKNLSITQKAFLSAQTGGPGGLLGGFQIEQELRAGKMDEVLDKVRETMKKQIGGNILGLDDVKTQADAAQFQKQVMVLQNGPLGQFAKDPASAYRILEGFRNKDLGIGNKENLSDTIVKDTMIKGQDISAQSNTILQGILHTADAIRTAAEATNQNLSQLAFTQGVGMAIPDRDVQTTMRTNLRENRQGEENAAGARLKINEDQMGTDALDAMHKFTDIFKQLPAAAKAPLEAVKEIYQNNGAAAADKEYKQQLATLDQAAMEAKASSGQDQKKRLEEIAKERSTLRTGYNLLQKTDGNLDTSVRKEGFVSPGLPSLNSSSFTSGQLPSLKNTVSNDHLANAVQSVQQIRNKQETAKTTATGLPTLHQKNGEKIQVDLKVIVEDRRAVVVETKHAQGAAANPLHNTSVSGPS